MRSTAIVVCCLISFSICSDWPTSKWCPDDHAEHECRACKAVTIDKSANCPSDDYFCDDKQPLRAFVLNKDSCYCQSIACANKDFRLAVNGSIVDRIRCDRREWFTIYGETVPSTICIKPKPVTSTTTSTSTSTATPAVLCPEMTKYPVADCNEANPGRTCAEAIITPTSVYCALPGSALYIPSVLPRGVPAPLRCVGTDWMLPDGVTTLEQAIMQKNGAVACYKETEVTTVLP